MGEGQRLVFVGGLHRSGTTPLARALAGHPEISGLTGTGVREDEGQHLQDVYPKIRTYGGVGRFANSPESHLTEDSPLISPEQGRRLLSAWEPYWDLSRPLLMEKSPSNLVMGRFLQAIFPGSALIVVVRHPVVVALATKKWSPKLISRRGQSRTTLESLISHWVRAHETLREDAPYLRRLHVMRYEDLVANPVRELAGVQEFLGLSTPIPSESLRPDESERYRTQWAAMATGGPLQRLRYRRMKSKFGPIIAEFGYEVCDLSSRSTSSVIHQDDPHRR